MQEYVHACVLDIHVHVFLLVGSFFQLFSLLQSFPVRHIFCTIRIMPAPIAPNTSTYLYIPAHVWTKAEMDRCLQSHPLWLEDNCTQSFAVLSLTVKAINFQNFGWLHVRVVHVCVRVCVRVGGERVLIYLFNWRVPPRSQLRVLENRLIICWTLMKLR